MPKNQREITSFNFDIGATQYDEVFTYSNIGVLQRNRVYHWLETLSFFKRPKKIFEINCGTGYDAEQFHNRGHSVVATDGSAEMIKLAKAKRDTKIDFFQLRFSDVSNQQKFENSQVLFSNFGGLNCIDSKELRIFAEDIAKKQSVGDLLIWVIMPKKCLMESIYFLFTFQFSKMFRRNTSKPTPVNFHDTAIPTFYHSPKELKRILKNDYDIELIKPVALFLPPSYMEGFFKQKKSMLRFLNALESIFGNFSAGAAWSDHFILIAKKQ